AARIVALRSRTILRLSGHGGMLSVLAPHDRIRQHLTPGLQIAVVNGPEQVVVSGTPEELDTLAAHCETDGIQARRIAVDYASHSPQVEELREELLHLLAPVTPRTGHTPLISTVTGQAIDTATMDAAYWFTNLRETVRFDTALTTLLTTGHRIFVETSPHPVLLGAVAQNAGHHRVAGVTAVGTLRRQEHEPAQLLRSAAEVFAVGVDVDWTPWTGAGRLTDLPTYAFQHRRFWQPAAATATDVGTAGLGPVRHPLLGAALPLAGGDDLVLTGRISRTGHPWLADHGVFGAVVLPGTAFVELVLRAGEETGLRAVRELTLHAPLPLPEHGEVDLQVQVGAADGRGARPVDVYARPRRSDGAPEWTHHASALLTGEEAAEAATAVEAAWPPAGAQRLDVDAHHDAMAALGLEYGPAFQGLSDVWRSGDAILAQVTLPGRQAEEAAAFGVHPALLDAALQAAAVDTADGPAPLPFSFGSVALYGRGASEARVRITPAGPDTFTVELADRSGAPLVRIDSLLVRRVTAGELATGEGGSTALLSVVWSPLDTGAAEADGAEEATLLVVGEGPAEADGPARARAVLERTLERLREWLAQDRPAGARLVVVTRRAVPTGAEPDGAAVHLDHAPVWGLARAARAENPGRIVLVDVDADAADPVDEAAVRAAVRSGRPELALRDGRVYAPELRRGRAEPAGDPAAALGTGTVLITGGTSGLGAQVARHAAALGARHLLLLSRRGPGAEGAEELRAELTAAGARVTVRACDVADREQLAAVLREVPEEFPLTAVVHSSGVLRDGLLGSIGADDLDAVLRPKVDAVWHLHELTAGAQLSAFVAFSSVAGVLGGAGQGGYAAANAFLDALMQQRRRTGRPGLSVAWGLWAEATGMTGHLDGADLERINRGGITALGTAQGLGLLDAALTGEPGDGLLLAVALNEPVLRATGPDLLPPLLAGLFPPRRRAGVRRAAGPAGPAGRPALDSREATVDRLRYRFARTMGFDTAELDVAASLVGQGLDSVMAMQIRGLVESDFGQTLPVASMFNGASVESIADRLMAGAGEAGPLGAEESGADREAPELVRHPATRDVVRLLRAEQQGTPGVTHHIGLAVRLSAPTTPERLVAAVTALAGRHAALRTAIVPDAEHGQQLEVRRGVPDGLLRWSAVAEDTDVDDRLRELMEPPFDLATASLWRFELLARPSGEQVLVFGAHHAVSDLASLMLVAHELDAGLGPDRDAGPDAASVVVSNRDIDLLLRAQAARPDGDRDPSSDWRADFTGARRLDLELARPRPARRSYRSATHLVELPAELQERVAAAATGLGITPAAFWLGALTVHLARLRERDRFVLAVPVDTRLHVGALDAVGYFGLPIPYAAEVGAGESAAEVLRRTDARLTRVLEQGVTFFDVMSALVEEGLYRKDAPLVEVYFNYMPPQAGASGGLRILPAGTGWSDLDLMVTVMPGLGKVGLEYNADVLDDASCAELGRGLLALAADITESPDTLVATPESTDVSTEPVPAGQVAVAATFALGNLPAMLGVALEDGAGEGGPLAVAEAPYHQVLASLHDPGSVLAEPATVAGLVLLRPGDLVRFAPGDEQLLDQLAEEYPAALAALAERTRKPLVVAFLPERSPDELLRGWERRVAERLADRPGVAVLDSDLWLEDFPPDEVFDDHTDQLAHLPFQEEFQAVVALQLADLVGTVRRRAPKVIVVDGDETLWSGIAGEAGPENVDLTGARELLARRLLQWRSAGVLLALVSNNDEATVHAVLDRPDSLLRREHFAAISAAWEPKWTRIARIAEELRLGLDSFLFLDDNPVEIAGVRAQLPEVLCLTCPPAAELDGFVHRLWPMTPIAATAEDAARAAFYQQEQVRDEARAQLGFAEFLENLKLELDIVPVSAESAERTVQLSRRTNQFNLRPRPLDAAGLDRLRQDGGEVWTATARDRFGEYGQIGVLAVRPAGDALELVAWMMSCRVLGRGVEDRLLQWLADRAEALGLDAVRLVAEHTPRNVPARRLVSRLGGGEVEAPRLETVVALEQLRAFRSWDLGTDIAAEVSNA
ncbi:HAD-IIIC family phosphatase, partial [Kitasatospora purpeofusca]|uniref:HAD-IIIC family phosphatase n=1 Tax=Kitasatospora purpeofusca TaxID=67352 RepID=UPI0033D63782